MLNIFQKKIREAFNIRDHRFENLLGLLKKGGDSRCAGPREAFGFIDKDRIHLHRPYPKDFLESIYLAGKDILLC